MIRFIGMASSVCMILTSANIIADSVVSTQDWERREILTTPEQNNEIVVEQKQQGLWKSDGFTGKLNYLIADAGDEKHRLYVQWFDSTGQLAYSVGVREFNVQPEYALQIPKCVNKNCTKAIVRAEHAFEKVPQDFLLELTSLGRYSVGLQN